MDEQRDTKTSPPTPTTTSTPMMTTPAEGMTSGLTKSGVIPLRHASLPGHVKLPRRYEKAAMGTKGQPSRLRKMSIQPCVQAERGGLRESLNDRLHDLMAAIMWLKQELIMLRQHDILLKRQFFDIQHSIHSLQKPKTSQTTTPSKAFKSTTATAATNANNNNTTGFDTNSGSTTPSSPPPPPSSSRQPSSSNHPNHHHRGNHHHQPDNNNNNCHDAISTKHDGDVDGFLLEAYVVRPCSSVTLLNDDSEDDDDEDLMGDDSLFRPRTSSMMTSRDMAALARRRGSKELI